MVCVIMKWLPLYCMTSFTVAEAKVKHSYNIQTSKLHSQQVVCVCVCVCVCSLLPYLNTLSIEACVWGLKLLRRGEWVSLSPLPGAGLTWSWSASESEDLSLALELQELAAGWSVTTVEFLTFLRIALALENLLKFVKSGDFLPGLGLVGWGDSVFWPVGG